jgi:hypothetical protein
MKYTKEGPIITLTEDDTKFMADKVQDRGEDVVHDIESHREEIMAKLIEFHETLHQLQFIQYYRPQCSNLKRHNYPLCKKKKMIHFR